MYFCGLIADLSLLLNNSPSCGCAQSVYPPFMGHRVCFQCLTNTNKAFHAASLSDALELRLLGAG